MTPCEIGHLIWLGGNIQIDWQINKKLIRSQIKMSNVRSILSFVLWQKFRFKYIFIHRSFYRPENNNKFRMFVLE